jgi:hypothetical protein
MLRVLQRRLACSLANIRDRFLCFVRGELPFEELLGQLFVLLFYGILNRLLCFLFSQGTPDVFCVSHIEPHQIQTQD